MNGTNVVRARLSLFVKRLDKSTGLNQTAAHTYFIKTEPIVNVP